MVLQKHFSAFLGGLVASEDSFLTMLESAMLSSNLEIILVHCLVRVSSAVSHRMRERYETQKVSNLTLRLQRQFIGVIAAPSSRPQAMKAPAILGGSCVLDVESRL